MSLGSIKRLVAEKNGIHGKEKILKFIFGPRKKEEVTRKYILNACMGVKFKKEKNK